MILQAAPTKITVNSAHTRQTCFWKIDTSFFLLHVQFKIITFFWILTILKNYWDTLTFVPNAWILEKNINRILKLFFIKIENRDILKLN